MSDKKIKHRKIKKLIATAFGVLLCLGIIIDFTPLGGGNIQTYGKAITCLRWPVHGVRIKGRGHYERAPLVNWLPQEYIVRFCNELEAENAGYSAEMFRDIYKYRTDIKTEQ